MKPSPLEDKPKHRNTGASRWQVLMDQLSIQRTVRSWRRRTRKQARRHKLSRLIERLPHARLIGDILYQIGFWFEYMLICAGRSVMKTCRAVAMQAGRLMLLILRPFLLGIITLWTDLTEPFRRFRSGMRHIGELSEVLPTESDREIRKEKFRYFRRGTKLYLPLALNALSYLLPVAACAALVYIVHNQLNNQYILEVQVGGETVGFVSSEQVFENASDDVQNRINTAKSVMEASGNTTTDDQWSIEPSYTLTVGTQTMTEGEVANAILSTTSAEVTEGTAVYVDGNLQFILSDGDHLRAYLEAIKAPYEQSSDSDARVSFVHDISLVDGVYLQNSLTTYEEVLRALNEGGGTQTYTAAAGDTVQTVLDASGVSWDSLAALNPELTDTEQELEEGQQVITGVASPDLLQVKVIVRDSYTSEIPYDTVETESSDYDFGETVVTTEGQNGLQEITQDLTYIDGTLTEISTVSVETLIEPVTEYITRGTHLQSGMTASYGTGEWMWPVPQYTYVSRWMSSYHNGADICAPYGTPIYASDSGEVVTAGSHWSYGNYVVIDHGNGWTTLYGHMSALGCSVGQAVERGDIIGYVGSTGVSTGNHCHFEMRHNGALVSAQSFFSGM